MRRLERGGESVCSVAQAKGNRYPRCNKRSRIEISSAIPHPHLSGPYAVLTFPVVVEKRVRSGNPMTPRGYRKRSKPSARAGALIALL